MYVHNDRQIAIRILLLNLKSFCKEDSIFELNFKLQILP